jgi:hypothetical protein
MLNFSYDWLLATVYPIQLPLKDKGKHKAKRRAIASTGNVFEYRQRNGVLRLGLSYQGERVSLQLNELIVNYPTLLLRAYALNERG